MTILSERLRRWVPVGWFEGAGGNDTSGAGMFRHALVLGKFYPPHAGHHRLVRAAAARSARVAVWELHVGIMRAVLARRAIQDGDPTQAAVDAVFSSEDYGAELANRLGAKHVSVDPDRWWRPSPGRR